MSKYQEYLNESIGQKIKRAIQRLDWWLDADTRSPEELRDQIRDLDDDVLKIWAKESKWAKVFASANTGRHQLQNKIVKQEMKRRNLTLTESIRTADFDAKNIARQYKSWKDFAGDATKGQAMTLNKLMKMLKTKDKDYANDVSERIKKILRGY